MDQQNPVVLAQILAQWAGFLAALDRERPKTQRTKTPRWTAVRIFLRVGRNGELLCRGDFRELHFEVFGKPPTVLPKPDGVGAGVSAVDSRGRTIWIADAQRGHGKAFHCACR
jgi:hypothetical protein